jgi:hypothetical protein
MTSSERDTINKLMSNLITTDIFIKDFSVDISTNPIYVKELLEIALAEKNTDDVEYVLYIGFTFNVFSEEYVEILSRLIEAKWHYQHENIAMILQKLKSPISVESLYKAAITEYEYLDYDDNYALAVKCIWALGNINNYDSRKKLEVLSHSKNEIIRDNAIKQLSRN